MLLSSQPKRFRSTPPRRSGRTCTCQKDRGRRKYIYAHIGMTYEDRPPSLLHASSPFHPHDHRDWKSHSEYRIWGATHATQHTRKLKEVLRCHNNCICNKCNIRCGNWRVSSLLQICRYKFTVRESLSCLGCEGED